MTAKSGLFSPTGLPLSKQDLPALLSIAEENGMPLDVSLFNDVGGQVMEMREFVVRRRGECVEMRGPRGRAELNFSAVERVRAIHRGANGAGRLCVECLDREKRCLLAIAGPETAQAAGAQVWHTLLSTLSGTSEAAVSAA